MAYSRMDSTIDIVRRMRYLRPGYAFREKWHYNNIVRQNVIIILFTEPGSDSSSFQHYMVAQHLVELFAGRALEDFVVERIFEPLNMTSSTFSLEYAAATGNLSESYSPFGRRIPHWLDREDMPVIAGAAGVLSSAVDLLRWGKALLGVTNSSLVGIPEDILNRCMAPESIIDANRGLTYGFGWIQASVLGYKV
jgi:CubicO group peptidase (beta-lactamase class C family)